MSTIVILSGSPSRSSRTDALLAQVSRLLVAHGHAVDDLKVRDLPAEALLSADFADPDIRAAITRLTEADAVVVGTPVYKATYSGLLKTFVDLVPMTTLQGKAVLPFVTGGSRAHVLALDLGLKPLLTTLGATNVGAGRFVLSEHITENGAILGTDAAQDVLVAVSAFLEEVRIREVAAAVRPVNPPAESPAARPAPSSAASAPQVLAPQAVLAGQPFAEQQQEAS